MRETIHIQPISRQHGLSLTMAGLILMPLVLLLGYLFDGRAQLVMVFLFLACMVTSLLGILKLREPEFSFSISSEHLHFHHRVGGWSLRWSNIIRVGQPTLIRGFESVDLPYVGIKVRDVEALLSFMMPRLAVNLLTEQRPLLSLALRYGAIERHELQDWIVEDNHYRAASGQQYSGVIAMLGHRMGHLRDLYGYDLLIHESSLDRDASDFVRLLRDYLLHYQAPTDTEPPSLRER